MKAFNLYCIRISHISPIIHMHSLPRLSLSLYYNWFWEVLIRLPFTVVSIRGWIMTGGIMKVHLPSDMEHITQGDVCLRTSGPGLGGWSSGLQCFFIFVLCLCYNCKIVIHWISVLYSHPYDPHSWLLYWSRKACMPTLQVQRNLLGERQRGSEGGLMFQNSTS